MGRMMTNLAFALDGLYAAGWWPSSGDDCQLSEDQRWYPSPSSVLEFFTRRGTDLEISLRLDVHQAAIRWHTPESGPQSITAATQTEALILAFTDSYRAQCRKVSQERLPASR